MNSQLYRLDLAGIDTWTEFYDLHTRVQYGIDRIFLSNELYRYWPLIEDYEPPTRYHDFLVNYNRFLMTNVIATHEKYGEIFSDDLQTTKKVVQTVKFFDDMTKPTTHRFWWPGVYRLPFDKQRLFRQNQN